MMVFAVHAVRAEEISATEVIFRKLSDAQAYAKVLSNDPGVLAGAVTRFVLDTPGRRTALVLYVAGQRQAVPHVSNDRRVLANGHGSASVYRRVT